MAKIVIVIQGTDRKPWKALGLTQSETWAMDTEDVPICYFEGRSGSIIGGLDSFHEYMRWSPLFGRGLAAFDRMLQIPMRLLPVPEAIWEKSHEVLRIPIPDMYITGSMQLLAELKWVIDQYNPEWIYRTNVSSFVHIGGLVKYVKERQPVRFYGGTPFSHPRGQFASGSSTLLSRDVAELILSSRDKWLHRYLDDLALGVLMQNLKIPFTPTSSRWVTNLEQVDAFSDDELLDVWHYRCKSVRADGSRFDGNVMRALSRRFKALDEVNGNA